MQYKSVVTSAIILAGGLGTRLRDILPDLPKPMAPVGGRPFLEYQLDYWIAQGINRFVISVGHRYENISNYFGNSYRGTAIDYAIEQTPLGTGGGFLLAAEKIRGDAPFLLLNGDTYFAVELSKLSEFSQANDADWSFCLFQADEEGRYMGMNVSSQGQITSLKSGSGLRGRLANGGVYLVHPRALFDSEFNLGVKFSLEDDILPAAMHSGKRLFGLKCSGSFIDIGVPSDYQRASALLASSGEQTC